MGQRLTVSATPIGSVAVFSTDRSVTGQDGAVFTRDGPSSGGPASAIAAALFAGDPQIDHVFVASNTVSVRRAVSWDGSALGHAADVIAELFVHYPEGPSVSAEERAEALRAQHYNATLVDIRAHSDELWVIEVRPDEPAEPFQPGQYATLALGYWEPRADDAVEEFTDDGREKLARRSYSVSSSILGEDGELVEANPADIEFYIVKVRPGETEIPALTPRLFTKSVGDRLYLGRKFAGHYTLDDVNPEDNVVFLSTGTGEAPQNALTAELLRRGHAGRIVNAVCVRYRADLGYTEQQAAVMARFPNYRYLSLTTREPENEGHKMYIQDLITSGALEEALGAPLDPAHTQVFLCGNPSMIGLPKWDDAGKMTFSDPVGVCELLVERGFTIDNGRKRGNVHYEEYWKDR